MDQCAADQCLRTAGEWFTHLDSACMQLLVQARWVACAASVGWHNGGSLAGAGI
jgi:hypothetical protein